MTRFLICCGTAALSTSAHASLPEMDTVFYGRVVHLGGGEEHVLTSGELKWTVSPPAGSSQVPLDVVTQLASMKGGSISYQVRIPAHLAVQSTLTGVLPGLTLATDGDALFKNTAIRINNRAVRLADPAGIAFAVSSATRGTFRRLDFIVDGPLPDADGDGLPDWWEEKYGTGLHAPSAGQDTDGDGVSNLAEYRAGTDPSGTDQLPKIASEWLVSLPLGGKGVPVIRAVDADSPPARLTYTVGGMPAGMHLGLLHPTAGVQTANAFTQADLDAGRVLITHTGNTEVDLSLPLTLRDETAGHPPVSTTLRITASPAASLWQGWGLPDSAQPAVWPAVQDASRLSGGASLRAPSGPADLEATAAATAPADVPRLFIGTPGADILLGSAQPDLIAAGAGDRVRGGAGADRLLLGAGSGLVTLTDFSLTEKDVIDLRGVLQPTPGRWLPAYVQLAGQELRIDANGDGSGYTDLTVSLPGSALPAEVSELWDSGALETGMIVPKTTLYLTTAGQPAEENLAAATLTLRRLGDASIPLTVPLVWSGTALMGRDYATLPSSAVFPAGAKTVSFSIQPLADDDREPLETVQLTVGTNPAWDIASGSSSVTLTLLDLPSRVWLEVAEGTAFKDSLSPAQVIVRRSGPMAASLTVQLTVTGQATPGVDYRRLPSGLTLAAAQESLALDILPLAGGTLSRGAEAVVVSIRPDTSYSFGPTPVARVVIVERPTTLAAWASAQGLTGNPDVDWTRDPDGDGLSNLLEFGLGGNPLKADPPQVRVLRDAAGRLGMEYTRWPGAPELTYLMEQSSNLQTWSVVGPAALEEMNHEILPNGMERVSSYLRQIPGMDSTYLRVKVSNSAP